jgi:DNA invertase Pin-like site-specific DNA recombinase
MPGYKDRTAARAIQAVLYARVSSKDQEKEGFSIPAQQRLLREYAITEHITVLEEFVDVETASHSGRSGFAAMLQYLKKHACRTILVEKTDRLYRNLKDWSTLDELGVTNHFVKENTIIGPETRSAEQFVHGIKVLVARNHSQNLSEETQKGMLEKARSGIYPSCASVGYRNVEGPNGKRILAPDGDTAPVITELFENFRTGKNSVKSLAAQFRQEGRTLAGRQLHPSLLHQILRKRLYMGDFDWDGTTYRGTHEPLVTRECWERVQEILDTRAENKTRKVKHDFAYTGLVHCGHRGCMLVGELKKGKYVYYHCTGNRGKCPEPYARQEVVAREFGSLLQEIVIPQSILEWLGDAVLSSDRTEQAAREQTMKRLQGDYQRINTRIETMYTDKLDGRITGEFFDQRSVAWRDEQNALLRRMQDIQKATPAPIDEAINLMQLTSRACELFTQQSAAEQRRLLQAVVQKSTWQDGTLRTTLFEPFEILRHSNRESHRKEKEIAGSGQDSEIWLPENHGFQLPLRYGGALPP